MTTKTDHELSELLLKTREALRSERFSAAGARAKDSNAPRKLRAKIARVLRLWVAFDGKPCAVETIAERVGLTPDQVRACVSR